MDMEEHDRIGFAYGQCFKIGGFSCFARAETRVRIYELVQQVKDSQAFGKGLWAIFHQSNQRILGSEDWIEKHLRDEFFQYYENPTLYRAYN